jgi:hypothetical protein
MIHRFGKWRYRVAQLTKELASRFRQTRFSSLRRKFKMNAPAKSDCSSITTH